MPFTNVDLVKKHLLQHQVGFTEKENILVKLAGNASVQLPDRNLVADSEKIKGKEEIVPNQQAVDFSQGDIIQLPHTELIPDTVVVATDSSLGQIFVENVDYHLDYESGRVTRLSPGSIPANSQAVIWYLFFRVYQAGVDYSIDYQKGEITRLADGAIEEGQWVFVDYQVEFGLFSDDLIANAILEADGQILSRLDPTYLDSTEQNLITSETYWAVSILCNMKALEAANQNLPGNQAKALFEAWSLMAGVYRGQADETLSPFLKPVNRLEAPLKVNYEG